MTNELEKQFFDTFGIEAKQKCAKPLLKTTSGFCKAYKNCVGCDYNDLKYPQIADRILLELICILNRYFNATGEYPIMLLGLNYESLKEYILKRCIHNEYNIRQQVRTLFEEDNNDR